MFDLGFANIINIKSVTFVKKLNKFEYIIIFYDC